MKKNILITVFLVLMAVIYFTTRESEEELSTVQDNEKELINQDEKVFDSNYFDEEEAVSMTKEYLNILQRIYYINQDESVDSDNVSGFIMSELGETIKDRNSLNYLLSRIEKLKTSNIEGFNLTGFILEISILGLIDSHNNFISFLRDFDESSTDISEYRYQLSLFKSNANSTYVQMAEGLVLLPYVFFELNEDSEDLGGWRISQDSREEILSEIDRLFADIFSEDDLNYKQTKHRDVSVVVVRQLKDILQNN